MEQFLKFQDLGPVRSWRLDVALNTNFDDLHCHSKNCQPGENVQKEIKLHNYLLIISWGTVPGT